MVLSAILFSFNLAILLLHFPCFENFTFESRSIGIRAHTPMQSYAPNYIAQAPFRGSIELYIVVAHVAWYNFINYLCVFNLSYLRLHVVKEDKRLALQLKFITIWYLFNCFNITIQVSWIVYLKPFSILHVFQKSSIFFKIFF